MRTPNNPGHFKAQRALRCGISGDLLACATRLVG
jgi:hypothetical protein